MEKDIHYIIASKQGAGRQRLCIHPAMHATTVEVVHYTRKQRFIGIVVHGVVVGGESGVGAAIGGGAPPVGADVSLRVTLIGLSYFHKDVRPPPSIKWTSESNL